MNWLLLRGLSREQRHWGRFRDLMQAAFPNDTVRGLDLPGTGTEHLRTSPADVRAIMEDARARWLAQLESTPGPSRLLAVSLGGMVAMQWVADHPEDFERVVLINTSAANLSVPWRRLRLGVVPGILRALVSGDGPARQKRLLGVTARMVPDPDQVAEEFARIQADSPVTRTNVLRQLWAGTRFRAPKSLAIPTLVIAAAKDPLCDPECPKRLAARFGAPLETHPDAGHDLSLDDPEWLTARVRAWVDAVVRAA